MAFHQTNTGDEPNANVSFNTTNSEMDTSGARFVPIVDVTHDDDDTNSHMSDIPLQVPANINIPSNSSAEVTFSQAGSDTVQNVDSIQPIPNQTGVNPWQLQYPLTYPQSVLKKLFNWLLNEHEKLCTISTKRLEVLCSINKL